MTREVFIVTRNTKEFAVLHVFMCSLPYFLLIEGDDREFVFPVMFLFFQRIGVIIGIF